VRATNHVESPPKERYLRSAWIPPLFSLPIFFSLNLAGDEMRGLAGSSSAVVSPPISRFAFGV